MSAVFFPKPVTETRAAVVPVEKVVPDGPGQLATVPNAALEAVILRILLKTGANKLKCVFDSVRAVDPREPLP